MNEGVRVDITVGTETRPDPAVPVSLDLPNEAKPVPPMIRPEDTITVEYPVDNIL